MPSPLCWRTLGRLPGTALPRDCSPRRSGRPCTDWPRSPGPGGSRRRTPSAGSSCSWTGSPSSDTPPQRARRRRSRGLVCPPAAPHLVTGAHAAQPQVVGPLPRAGTRRTSTAAHRLISGAGADERRTGAPPVVVRLPARSGSRPKMATFEAAGLQLPPRKATATRSSVRGQRLGNPSCGRVVLLLGNLAVAVIRAASRSCRRARSRCRGAGCCRRSQFRGRTRAAGASSPRSAPRAATAATPAISYAPENS